IHTSVLSLIQSEREREIIHDYFRHYYYYYYFLFIIFRFLLIFFNFTNISNENHLLKTMKIHVLTFQLQFRQTDTQTIIILSFLSNTFYSKQILTELHYFNMYLYKK